MSFSDTELFSEETIRHVHSENTRRELAYTKIWSGVNLWSGVFVFVLEWYFGVEVLRELI